MCEVIQKSEEDDAKPYTMLVVPRGTYKTSIVRGALVWNSCGQILHFGNLYHRIVLASATLALGETSLRVIERQLQYNGNRRRLRQTLHQRTQEGHVLQRPPRA